MYRHNVMNGECHVTAMDANDGWQVGWQMVGNANQRQQRQVISISIYSPRSSHRNQVVFTQRLLHTCSHLDKVSSVPYNSRLLDIIF